MYCPEVSFFFQFSAFMMVMFATLVALGGAWYHDRYFVKTRNPRLRRPMRRGRRK
mgnify:CR=1 FL=1